MSKKLKARLVKAGNQGGFVSLLTCIMLSLLIIVVTLSLVAIETLQLHKSADSEQSLRAYYASEAGVEDAAAKVLSGTITADNLCSNPTPPQPTNNTSFDSTGQAGWTCQQVKFDGSPIGNLSQPDEAVTIDPGVQSLNPADQYNSIILEWNTNGNAAGNYNVSGALPDANSYVNGGGGGGPYAAPPLELTVIQYPDTFDTAAMCPLYNPGANCYVTVQNALLVPRGTGVDGNVDYKHGASGGFSQHGPFDANCGPQGRDLNAPNSGPTDWASITNEGVASYNCYAIIQNLTSSSNYIFRLRSRYLPSDYKVLFKNSASGAGSPITDLPTGNATIDVTARAGQSYRRVISELPLNRSASGGLNYVMYSDTDICKNFDVLANAAPTSGSCPSFP